MIKKSGFSLMEILVAVAIVGLMVGVMGPKAIQYLRSGKKRSAQLNINQIKDGIMKYNLDIGVYPKTLDHLKENVDNHSNWDGPYLADKFQDPWGGDFIYNRPPQEFTNQYKIYEIYCYGSDELENTPHDKWIHGGE